MSAPIPGRASARLHESIINYGGNQNAGVHHLLPRRIVRGHGAWLRKIEGKPLLVMAHGTVGLQHASMAIYNAYCDRVPVFIIVGNILDADARAAQASNGTTARRTRLRMVRDFINGTICRSRCSTSPNPRCAPIRSR